MENAATLMNIIRPNLLPHGNIKMISCILPGVFLTQNKEKLNCWKFLLTYADPCSQPISFDCYLDCCYLQPTSALTNSRTSTDLRLPSNRYCNHAGPFDFLWRFLLSDILCTKTTCNIRSVWQFFLDPSLCTYNILQTSLWKIFQFCNYAVCFFPSVVTQ